VAGRSSVPPARSKLIEASALEVGARRALLQRTHELEARVFRGAEPFEVYAARVFDAHELWIWTLEDPDGQLVGYNVIVYDQHEYRGKPIGIYRANVALLPEYRGHNRTVATGLRLAIPRLLRQPRRRLYFHAYLLHPSIYVMMDKYAETMWPTPRTDPPSPDALDLMTFLESRGGPPRWDPANPWVVRLDTSVAEDDAEIASWLKSERPSARYFFQQNPHYRNGGALVLLVPLTMTNLLRAVVRVATQRMKRSRS
jgi:GNAT superfamily N-acetyltransferase